MMKEMLAYIAKGGLVTHYYYVLAIC